MKCSKVHKLISPYIDGELPERYMKPLEDHMKVCFNCRTEFEESKELLHLFAHGEKFKAPYGFSTRVIANITSEKAKGFSWIPMVTRSAEVLVLLVIIFTGIISGTFLSDRLMAEKKTLIRSSFFLDIFEPTPPDSLGGVYLAMTEVKNEK